MVTFPNTVINPRTVVVELLSKTYPDTPSTMMTMHSSMQFFNRAVRTNEIRFDSRIQFRNRGLDPLITRIFKRHDNEQHQVQSFNKHHTKTNNQVKSWQQQHNNTSSSNIHQQNMTTIPLLANFLQRSLTWISNSSRFPLHTGYQDLKHISASPTFSQVKRSLSKVAFSLPTRSPHDQVSRNFISRLKNSQMQRGEAFCILEIQILQN